MTKAGEVKRERLASHSVCFGACFRRPMRCNVSKVAHYKIITKTPKKNQVNEEIELEATESNGK